MPDLRARVFDDGLVGAGAVNAQDFAYWLADPDFECGLAGWFGRSLGERVTPARLLAAIDRDIARIDAVLAETADLILHDPMVQQLEASWRGVALLVAKAGSSRSVRVRLLPVSWLELCREAAAEAAAARAAGAGTIAAAEAEAARAIAARAAARVGVSFDQGLMFDKIYTDEFGTAGGLPFGLMICDFPVGATPRDGMPADDVAVLRHLSAVAAAAFCPMIFNADPDIFGLDDFKDLGRLKSLGGGFADRRLGPWFDLRGEEDCRFLGLALPRILLRLPYTDDGSRNDGFPYTESADSIEKRLWGGAGYAFALVVMRAFLHHNWFADIRGAERDRNGGGLVIDLPVEDFATDRAAAVPKPSLEVQVGDRMDHELAELGFIVLRRAPYTAFSVFESAPSIQRPVRYSDALSTTNARLSAMLPSILCVSRFAHYIKVLGRDRVGSFLSAADAQDHLQDWLNRFVSANEVTGTAEHPLREGRVVVSEKPGRPGEYDCVMHLRPHFQLDDVATSFRLSTEIHKPRSGAVGS